MDKTNFDECVKEAIRLGRKWMRTNSGKGTPTREEWMLACMLYCENAQE